MPEAADPTRRELLQTGASLLAATTTFGSATTSAFAAPRRPRRPTPPNVVLILADDLGVGALGAYGQETLRTPNLDRMAAEGLRFTQGYSAAPMCAPSRCCLLTGMHNGHARVRDNSFTTTGIEPQLDPRDPTLGTVLRAAGYRTGVFGKWGFGDDDAYVGVGRGVGACTQDGGGSVGSDPAAGTPHPSHPLQQGFDEFSGLVTHNQATEGYYPNYIWEGNRRVDLPENHDGARGTFAPERYTDRALEFIARKPGRPFFCLYTPQLPHWPSLVPSTAPYDGEAWPDSVKRLAAQFTLLDTYVGRIRRTLERLNLDQRTLVLFASDNGPTPEERGAAGGGACTTETNAAPEQTVAERRWNTSGGLRGAKHSLYEGGIRTPLIAWGPGVVRTDRRAPTKAPWTLSDVLPTLADLAGIASPSDVDGVSVRRRLTGESSARRTHPLLYWERPPYFTLATTDGELPPASTYAQAVRDGRWKLVRFAPGTDPTAPDDQWRVQLYDLLDDPSEARDVALLHPRTVKRLVAVIKREHAPQPYERRAYKARRTGRGFDVGRRRPASRRRRRRRSRERARRTG